jgi:hypothetical protein
MTIEQFSPSGYPLRTDLLLQEERLLLAHFEGSNVLVPAAIPPAVAAAIPATAIG